MNLTREQKIGLAVILPILGIVLLVLSTWILRSSICGHWSFDADLCQIGIDGYSKLTAILSAVITLVIVSISAFYAVNTYRKNASLEHAKWLFNLYEKFYEKEHLKDIRNALDCSETTKEVENLVEKQPFEFTDYLNFFEFVAFLKKSEQITFEEINDLFGYYLSCISRHKSVRKYLKPNGYEMLDDLLEEMSREK
jgi:hypothetical protein